MKILSKLQFANFAKKKYILPTKIIMHLKRNKKCKENYDEEIQFLEEEQSKVRKKYEDNYQDQYKESNQELLRKKRAKNTKNKNPRFQLK